jgi:hypothetical protein
MANVHLQDYFPEQSCYDELLNSLPRSWRPDLNEAVRSARRAYVRGSYLSRICAAPSACLSYLLFKYDRYFPAECRRRGL